MDEEHKGPKRNEAFSRYSEIQHTVKPFQELPSGNPEGETPPILYTGTGLDYAREQLSKYGAFRHNKTPIFLSPTFRGAAGPATARTNVENQYDTPIVMVVDSRVGGINAKRVSRRDEFKSDQIPRDAILAAYKVDPSIPPSNYQVYSLAEIEQNFERVKL